MKPLLILIGLALALMLYIRLAPSDPARWHVVLETPQDRDTLGSATRVLPGQAGRMNDLHRVALATPRTRLLAGGPGQGHATYVTRSLLWGFPDYTTVWTDGDALVLHGRLRFGRGDMGVNRRRIEGWIAALNAT